MAKKQIYLVLDCETATLPFTNEMTLTAKQKQRIATSKPLIYDIAWQLVTRNGEVLSRKSYLVTEIFSVPSVFNTAYYKEKRPKYLEKLANGEIILKDWNSIAAELLADCHKADFCAAYNANFDFKRAIPFTEAYIAALYSPSYEKWEKRQRKSAEYLAEGRKGSKDSQKEKEEDAPIDMVFQLRSHDFLLIDIWGVACRKILNNQKYKKDAIREGMVSDSGLYFSTNAQAAYRYISKDYGFIEAHTALEDVEIETEILAKALKKGKIELGIKHFPFHTLGTTTDYCLTAKAVTKKELRTIIEIMSAKLTQYEERHSFAAQLERHIAALQGLEGDRT